MTMEPYKSNPDSINVGDVEPGCITFSILDEEVLRIDNDGFFIRGRPAKNPPAVLAALREFVEYVQEEDPRFKDLDVSFADDDDDSHFDTYSVPPDRERVRLCADGRIFLNREEIGTDQEVVNVLMAYLRINWRSGWS
jgi:hypothetical protein